MDHTGCLLISMPGCVGNGTEKIGKYGKRLKMSKVSSGEIMEHEKDN